MELRYVLLLMRKKVKLISICCLVGIMGFMALGVVMLVIGENNTLPPVPTSLMPFWVSATVYIEWDDLQDSVVLRDNVDSKVRGDFMSNVLKAGRTYGTMRKATSRIKEKIEIVDALARTRYSADSLNVLSVEATAKTPEQAVDLANAVAESLVEQIPSILPNITQIRVVEAASIPYSVQEIKYMSEQYELAVAKFKKEKYPPSATNRILMMAIIGYIAGLFIGLMLMFLKEYMNPYVVETEQATQFFNSRIIASYKAG